MSASIISSDATSITLQLTISLTSSMLETEEEIQTQLNAAGCLATQKALQQFDTHGQPIVQSGRTWSTKGVQPKTYQTPYGKVSLERHVYQTSDGGVTLCPLEQKARIILTSTPRFAQQISHKYAEMSSRRVVEDLRLNHGRHVPQSFVQELTDFVGSIVLAQEESWSYKTPKQSVPIQTLSIGIDGTCMLMCDEHYREAMVGTISLYDAQGIRQHTTYVAASPEYGKATFLNRMEREIERITEQFPIAYRQGLADGALENWDFLTPLTDTQGLDFQHALKYLIDVSKALYPRSPTSRTAWLDEQCHNLKHNRGAAIEQLRRMETIELTPLSEANRKGLEGAITYFRNHCHQMNYAEAMEANLPIGSGVTESACKVIVKGRLCGAGMKWKDIGAAVVLSLRTLTYTKGRWEQFWSKINKYGFSLAV